MNIDYDKWRYLMLKNSNKKTTPKEYGMYLREKKHKRKR